ncbi:FRG domain-containing protein [Pantoea dispersa]|uniref:FRG domain-containing protein n=1 Tax=Pantoea dispersa TaxID=59814 RepID=UPI001BAC97C1|nr:FRG domain-containing protein [Pantoea dispersa]MBS0900129.1 FRG domain-containing protein [Pantoea dispersa]
MEHYKLNSLDELKGILAQFEEGFLFRGQLDHFGEPNNPSIIASFDRQVCVPSETIKWMQYAGKVIDGVIGKHVNDHCYVQAILQHYGWRSFFVDCSSSPAVSAWFASHKFTEKLGIDMCEDCGENFLWERKKFAHYNYEVGDGHLYVIDKSIGKKVGLVDLASLTINGYLPRTEVQKAWLLGPTLGKPIPKECFVAQVTADRSIFREYAAMHGFKDTDSIFPPATKDPILKALLGLPWREIESIRDPEFMVPVFKRALDLPEYQTSFEKIASPSTAFYRGEKISDLFNSIETGGGKVTGGKFVDVPGIVIFGSANLNTPLRFPKIEKLLRGNNFLALEIDEIIKHPGMGYETVYQKGVGVINHAHNLIEICELVVMHPGLEMTKAGFSPGWFYLRKADGIWERHPHINECDCGNEDIHKRHISALLIAEDII